MTLTARIPLRQLWLPAVIIALIVLAAIFVFTFVLKSPEELDRATWARMQHHFDPAAVTKVEMNGPGQRATTAGPEAQTFAQALLAGTFNESNAQHFGPTAEIVVIYTFPGEKTFYPNQWPDGRFEVSWGGRQFLVSSPELARLLEEKGYVYRDTKGARTQ